MSKTSRTQLITRRSVRRMAGAAVVGGALLGLASPASAADSSGKFRIDDDAVTITSANADFGNGSLSNGNPTLPGLFAAYHDGSNIRGELLGKVFASGGCSFVKVTWDYADGTTGTSTTSANRACAVHPTPEKIVDLDSVAGKNLEQVKVELFVAADTVDPGQVAGTVVTPVGDGNRTTGTCARLDFDPSLVNVGASRTFNGLMLWGCTVTDATGRLKGSLDFPESEDSLDDATGVQVTVDWRAHDGRFLGRTSSAVSNRGAGAVNVDLASPSGRDALQADVRLWKIVNGNRVSVSSKALKFGNA